MLETKSPYFDQNMVLLEKNHPMAFEVVCRHLENGEGKGIEVVTAPNGRLNLKATLLEAQPILIHDSKEPGREAGIFLSMVPENSTGVVLMFGMGLGYSVMELLRKRRKIQYLVVFELNVEFFAHALKLMDLAETLSDGRLIICLEKPGNLSEVMAPVHRALMLEDIHTLTLTSCARMNREYEELAPIVADYISAFNSEGNTKLTHGRTFIENRLKHLTSMHHDRKLEELDGRFRNVPAIIIAAGPSLDKNIDQIRQAEGKAVIISVDSALPALLDKGIVPHFVTSIDYNWMTWKKIAGVAANPACRETNLICTTWVTDRVPKRFPAKNVFWAYSRNALENWINGMMGGKVSIGGAGTVAHLNFVSANLMGCDPIIFIGQDLAFSNRKGHSNNVVLSSNEKVKNQLETGQDIFWVKGNVEAKVPTSRQMNGYQRTFEKMIQESENCVINATEGGVFIEGAEHMPLVKAIDKYCKEEFSVKIEDLMNPPVLTAALESVLVEINKAERVVQKAEKISGPVQKKLMQMEKKGTKVSSFSEFPEAFRVKVSDLDRCHKRADNMQLFSLFDEITLEGLRQNEREKKAVDALEGDPEKYFEWFSRSVLRVDKINKIRMENLAWLKEKINETVRYHKAENQFMERLDADSPDKQIFLKLAELYLQAGNIILLETLLDQSRTAFCETVDYHYYLGLINLYRDNYAAAWEKRLEILQSDKKYADQLHGKMHEVSTFYLKQAMSILKRTGKSKDRNYIGEMLLFDAIKSCPDNDEAAEEVRRIAKSDFERVQLVFQKANGEIDSPERKIIKNWTIRMPEDPVLAGVLGENTVCGFHLLYGKVLAIQGDYQNALENYQAACSVRPNAPDIHIAMADLCFEAKNFESGLAFLKKAVELDRNYAVYWCNIGNNLKAAEDYRGAIAAYEQYFMALPEKIEVLKDIGDCYMKLGELEAAHESFRQYKYLLNKG